MSFLEEKIIFSKLVSSSADLTQSHISRRSGAVHQNKLCLAKALLADYLREAVSISSTSEFDAYQKVFGLSEYAAYCSALTLTSQNFNISALKRCGKLAPDMMGDLFRYEKPEREPTFFTFQSPQDVNRLTRVKTTIMNDNVCRFIVILWTPSVKHFVQAVVEAESDRRGIQDGSQIRRLMTVHDFRTVSNLPLPIINKFHEDSNERSDESGDDQKSVEITYYLITADGKSLHRLFELKPESIDLILSREPLPAFVDGVSGGRIFEIRKKGLGEALRTLVEIKSGGDQNLWKVTISSSSDLMEQEEIISKKWFDDFSSPVASNTAGLIVVTFTRVKMVNSFKWIANMDNCLNFGSSRYSFATLSVMGRDALNLNPPYWVQPPLVAVIFDGGKRICLANEIFSKFIVESIIKVKSLADIVSTDGRTKLPPEKSVAASDQQPPPTKKRQTSFKWVRSNSKEELKKFCACSLCKTSKDYDANMSNQGPEQLITHQWCLRDLLKLMGQNTTKNFEIVDKLSAYSIGSMDIESMTLKTDMTPPSQRSDLYQTVDNEGKSLEDHSLQVQRPIMICHMDKLNLENQDDKNK